MAESLKAKTVKGTLWSTVERFSVQGIQFIIMILMARILTPKDYGLVGMLTIFIAISQALIDSGFSQALIRKHDRTELDNSTVFYFNIAVGIILYGILFFCAPLIADFYKQPLLTPLTRVIGLTLVINSFVVVQRALLTIKIDFKTQAKATLIGAIASGVVGIWMAYTGFGVWAIVAQQLTNYGLIMILLWVMSHWRPALIYSWKSFKELFSFGSKLAISAIIETIYQNVYLLVIGKVFSASDLGYYTRAQQFAAFPSSNITGILQRVTYPVLCTIQNDDDHLRSVYRRFLKLSAFIVFPLMMGLSAVSHPFIMLILGQKWIFAAVLLQIICFSMMWYPIHAINLNLLQVKGRSDLFLKLEIWKKVVGIAILCITIPMGLIPMVCGSILSSIISLIINTHYTGKLLQLGFIMQMRDLLPTLLYSLTMFGIVFLVQYIIPNDILALVSGILVGLIYFFTVTYLTKSSELKELTTLIREKRGKK